MSLLTEFPSGYAKPEPLNKSFDMVVRDWSRQQFGGDDIVDEIRKALNTGVTTFTPTGTNDWNTSGVHNSGTIATSAYGASTYGAGNLSALRLENLDNTMTSVLATAEHLKIFRFLHKEPSKQPFYQWNRRESYGSTRGSFGFSEGGAPKGGAGQWSRNGAYVKFLGTRGGVTHPAVLTNILGGMSVDPVAEDQLGRTMDFMQRIERAIMFGDEAILDNGGTDSNYDGLLKQLTTARNRNVIDMKGLPLTMDNIGNVAAKLVTEGKLLSFSDVTLFMSPQNIEDFGKLRYSTGISPISGPGITVDRADLTTSARTNLLAGLSIVGQATSFGVIPFEWSIFTEPVETGAVLEKGDIGAPGVPTAANGVGLTAYNAVTVAIPSGFGTTAGVAARITDINATSHPSNMDAGLYYYAVSAVNDFGESVATCYGSSNTALKGVYVPANAQVNVVITPVTGATSYRIYRMKDANTFTGTTVVGLAANSVSGWYSADGSPAIGGAAGPTVKSTNVATGPNWQYVGHTAAANLTFIDKNGTSDLYNNIRPGTNIAPLICRNSADLCIAQMSPLLKMPLAPTSTTFEYLLLLYHTLVLKAPERQFIFKNVGKLS